MKKKITLFLSLCLTLSFLSVVSYSTSLTAEETNETNFEVTNELSSNHIFTTMDKDGNVIEIDISELEKETQKEIKEKEELAKQGIFGSPKDIKVGVVNFKTKSSSGINTNYTEVGSNISGYTNGYYAADGAFLGFNENFTKVKFMQAGVIGWVNASEVEILDYNSNEVKSVNFYRAENGGLYHYGTNNIKGENHFLTTYVGPKQTYLEDNKKYYSYDGHYFYESYETMIEDYKTNTRKKAVNADKPYYNYYQYLSHRTKSNISYDVMDALVKEKVGSNKSKMLNLSSEFIKNQDIYGTNALLTFGVAANESGWGRSSIALNKNNLFGHAAYDSDPAGSANGYSSPAFSVYYHCKSFISEGYLDPKDYNGRYFGSHLGDKASGINVKYASDPYWGEKAASIAWQVDKKANYKDSFRYTIGIKNTQDKLNIRKETNTSSNALYQARNVAYYPFLILGEMNGQSINNKTLWYKIQSDPTLDENRNTMTQDKGEYDFDKYYGYIHSNYVDIVTYSNDGAWLLPSYEFIHEKLGFVYNNGYVSGLSVGMDVSTLINKINAIHPGVLVNVKDNSGKIVTKGVIATGYTYTLKGNEGAKTFTITIRGDVNGDGQILANDYFVIKKYIEGQFKLDGVKLKAADINKDGKILANDYFMVKKYKEGKYTIVQ